MQQYMYYAAIQSSLLISDNEAVISLGRFKELQLLQMAISVKEQLHQLIYFEWLHIFIDMTMHQRCPDNTFLPEVLAINFKYSCHVCSYIIVHVAKMINKNS